MAKGRYSEFKTPTKIQIGRCKTPVSSEMRDQLRIAAATFPELHKIFRYQMRFSVTGAQSEVFGLVCSAQTSRFQEIVSSLMASVQPLLDPGRYVDFTALRADDMPIMQTHGELLYERSS